MDRMFNGGAGTRLTGVEQQLVAILDKMTTTKNSYSDVGELLLKPQDEKCTHANLNSVSQISKTNVFAKN